MFYGVFSIFFSKILGVSLFLFLNFEMFVWKFSQTFLRFLIILRRKTSKISYFYQKAALDAPQNADFHATVGFKNQVLGVKGKLNNIAAPSFVWAPKPSLVVHTDLTKYDLSYYMVSFLFFFSC